MIHDPYLPDLAASLAERSAMLADSLSDLSDCTPLIVQTVAKQLVTDLGHLRAARVAEEIAEAVTREGQAQQYRSAFEAAPVEPVEDRDASGAIPWVLGAASLVLLVMAFLLARNAAADVIEQRDLYRALGDEAPAYRVMQ